MPLPSTPTPDSIRLQRIIQQRKRMQLMTRLIYQQRDELEIVKKQNQSLINQLSDSRIECELTNDKLTVSARYNQQLTQGLVRQIQLVERFRHLLMGNSLHLSYQQHQSLLDQISNSYQILQALTRTTEGVNLSPLRTAYTATNTINTHLHSQIQKLTEENQQLNVKYQQLCKDYLELSKDNKLKQYQLTQLTNQVNQRQSLDDHHLHQESCGHIKNKKKHRQSTSSNAQKPDPQVTHTYTLLFADKQTEISTLKQRIQKLTIELNKKDELIKQHRNNEQQQKRLLHYLKTKFNIEGKQLTQIATHSRPKSNLYEPKKAQMSSEMHKTHNKNSAKNDMRKSPHKEQDTLGMKSVLNMNSHSLNVKQDNPSSQAQNPTSQKPTQPLTTYDPQFKKTITKLTSSLQPPIY